MLLQILQLVVPHTLFKIAFEQITSLGLLKKEGHQKS